MKQIMIARNFLQTHPQARQPTYFVEKIWESIYPKYAGDELFNNMLVCENEGVFDISSHNKCDPKHHTIRSGKNFKTGDQVVLKVWSSKPYRSKTITITPPLTLTVYDIEIYPSYDVYINGIFYAAIGSENWNTLAENDGLSGDDMRNWFIPNPKKFTGFSGQILAWGQVKY